MPKIENKYLRTIESISKRVVSGKKLDLKRFHPDLDKEIVRFIDSCSSSMFPLVFDDDDCGDSEQIDFLRRSSFVGRVFLNLSNILFYLGKCRDEAARISESFLEKLPEIFEVLESDAQACYEKDPACRSVDEAILCYPGFRAVMIFRIAHELYLMGVEYLPRLLTEYAHRHTGIDIHPGAKIGRRFFIDHGTGVVIGETTVIGDDVVLYQHVTLGAKKFELQEDGNPVKGIKRHPNIGDNCVIYAGATILGGLTTIGKNSVIGANVWLTHAVPENSIVKKGDA